MFCVKCGNKLPDNAKFCNQCGNPVNAPAAAPAPVAAVPVQPVAPAPVQPVAPAQPAPVQPAVPVQPVQPVAPAEPVKTPKKQKAQKEKSGFNWKLLFIVLLIATLILGAGGYTIYRVYSNVVDGNAPFENFFGLDGDSDDDDKQNDKDDDRNQNDTEGTDQTRPNGTNGSNQAVGPTGPGLIYPDEGEYQCELDGLQFMLPNDMELYYEEDGYCEYVGDYFNVYVSGGLMEDVTGERLTNSKQFAQFYLDLYGLDAKCMGSMNGVYYVIVESEEGVLGFYVDGEIGWTLACRGDLDYMSKMIEIVTSGKTS